MTGIILRIVLPSAIAATMIAATVVWFVQADRDKRALDDARDYITGTEDARDATSDLPRSDDGNLGWLHDFINGR
jgi:hypothetical protein